MAYADYEFYTKNYHGTLSEEDFDRVSQVSAAFIRRITFRRSDTCGEMEEVRMAFCAACDVFSGWETTRGGMGSRLVASENNDGYSVSYVQEGPSGQTGESLLYGKAYQAAALFLEPTGLLYWGCDADDDECGSDII